VIKEIAHKEQKEIITVSQTTVIDPEKIDRLFEVTNESGFSEIRSIES